jgi:hypothetical protein
MNRSVWRAKAALALAAAACLPGAHATEVITFDTPGLSNIYSSFTYIDVGSFEVYTQNSPSIIGTADNLPESTAPAGNSTQFMTMLNNATFSLRHAERDTFDLLGFDFAYVPQPNSPPLLYDLALVIFAGGMPLGGWLIDPTVTNQSFTRVDDATQLAPFTDVTALNFVVCSFNPQTLAVCEFSVGQAGQFALDNIVLSSPIPEPTSALLWATGLAALGGAARRRAAHVA